VFGATVKFTDELSVIFWAAGMVVVWFKLVVLRIGDETGTFRRTVSTAVKKML